MLVRKMRKEGVREGLVKRMEELSSEIRCRMKVKEELGEVFWMASRIRQDCPLSPLLFNILLSDVEEELGKVKWGGIRLEKKRIYTLGYANDLVLLVEKEEEMRSMLGRFEKYLEGKRLKLNINKTKILRFKRERRRLERRNWRWKEKAIKEVKEYKYLGYMMQKNSGQEVQVRDRIKKAAKIIEYVWGIGKRRFEKDWGKRLWLFDKLEWMVLDYGMEI